MLINWFTVGAQVVNFLILVWLMRRYLYRPILKAIDARAKKVLSVVADADKKMSSATEQLSVYQKKVKDFDDDQARRSAQVDEAMKAQRTQQEQAIKHDASVARQLEADDLRNQQSEFADQLGRLVEQEVLAISRNTMTDLADANLEHQIVVMFMRRLTTLSETAHPSFSDALKASPDAALVTTSFDVTQADREALRNAVNSLAKSGVALTFGTSATNICGIELSCGGQRAAWTMADYLNGLSEKSTSLLNERFPQVKPGDAHLAGAPQATPNKAPAAPRIRDQAAT